MKRVTIVDDTGVRNVMILVTPEMRLDGLRKGRPIPADTVMFPAIDNRRHQVQVPALVEG